MNNKTVHTAAFVFLVAGGLNWLLVGVFGINLVEFILGTGMLAKTVYVLVGLSALYEIVTHKDYCSACGV